MLKIDAADIPHCVNFDLGCSSWDQITTEQIASFCEISKREDLIHLDSAFAITQGHRDVVAPHDLLAARSVVHFRQLITITNQTVGLNYGSEETTYLEPVCAGDRVRFHMTLLGGDPHPFGTLYRLSAELEIEGLDAWGLVTTLVFLTRSSRPSQEPTHLHNRERRTSA